MAKKIIIITSGKRYGYKKKRRYGYRGKKRYRGCLAMILSLVVILVLALTIQ